MKRVLLIIMMTGLSVSVMGSFAMFEDWQGATANQNIHGYNGWTGLNRSDTAFWTGGNTNAYIVDDGGGNLVARLNSPTYQSRGFRKGLGSYAINDGLTASVLIKSIVGLSCPAFNPSASSSASSI